jgi:heptosyltransferase-2
MHHAERLWRLDAGVVASAGESEIRPRLYPREGNIAEADAALRAAGWDGEALVAVAPGSVWGTKRWPHYAQLSQLIAHLGRVVVVGGQADHPLAHDIATAGTGVIDMTGELSLLASAALLAKCRALVTNDSAPLHLASAMNVPTVALFGPTTPSMGYGPMATDAAVVEHHDLDCRPCHAHGPMVCPLGHHRCMREVSPEEVASSLETLLRRADR